MQKKKAANQGPGEFPGHRKLLGFSYDLALIYLTVDRKTGRRRLYSKKWINKSPEEVEVALIELVQSIDRGDDDAADRAAMFHEMRGRNSIKPETAGLLIQRTAGPRKESVTWGEIMKLDDGKMSPDHLRKIAEKAGMTVSASAESFARTVRKKRR